MSAQKGRTNPIKSGYGKATVSGNIAKLIREGRERGQAVAIALHSARRAYRARYPRGSFPHWLKAGPFQNPVLESKKIEQAKKLFSRFTGHEGVVVEKTRKPDFPDAVLVVGSLDAIDYTTVRDGRREMYRHRFRKNARPLFCVSHDGRQIVLLGGAYDFTSRGIVDRRA